ncbi:BURP domain-containing protein BNM2A-like isoform X2 [Hevea brasiliensis]|uniref:BURP domain-containing protein BNM2A-like isoform X2 n=1 Tax=Hevea brasiliensis TaxID=3981 RepID=UPI0025F0ADEB|nr:BURP domain-containing protein BNM2A-like isoform X2 [Hevea brasiliensis]
MQCGHSNGAARDVPMQDHFHISTNDVIKNTSLQLYYKILNELYKRPPFIFKVPKLGKGFDNFVADFVEASYIGIFTPGDVYLGKVMPIYFPIQDPSTYPRFFTKNFISYPFPDLPKIFKHYPQAKISVEPEKCEIQPAQAGTKVCARDMESLHNFIHRSFGSEGELKIVETKYPTISAALLQDYIVLEDPQEIEGQGMVVCHPVSEALFCHYNVEAVKLVKVSLRGDSGDKVEAIAICHTDSSRWEHDHIVFRLLQVKPGSPVCHFLPAGHLVWVQSPASKAS